MPSPPAPPGTVTDPIDVNAPSAPTANSSTMTLAFAYKAPMITSVMPGKWRRLLSKGVAWAPAGHGTGRPDQGIRRNTGTITRCPVG